MTCAFYGFLEDLLIRSRVVGGLDLRGLSGRSHFASAVGST